MPPDFTLGSNNNFLFRLATICKISLYHYLASKYLSTYAENFKYHSLHACRNAVASVIKRR